MIQTLTIKVRLYPGNKDKVLIDDTYIAIRNAYNHVSKYIYDTKITNFYRLNELLYRELRNRYNLKSQMAQSVLKTVIAKYKTLISNKHDWTLIRFKAFEYDLVWNRDYSINKKKFSINTLNGRIKLNYNASYFKKYFNHSLYSFGTSKIIKKDDKYYLYIPVDVTCKEYIPSSSIVGIDRGINYLATTYDGGITRFFSGKAVKQKRAKYKQTRQLLQTVKTSSSRRRLKKLANKENRYISNINHCIAKALSTSNPLGTSFILEDLSNIRPSLTKVRLNNRYLSLSWAYSDLAFKLEYKAKLNGQRVLYVDPHYTSQACVKCAHISKNNRDKHKHIFVCQKCGYSSNDDRIGAMNLYLKGLDIVNKEHDSLFRGESLINDLISVNHPIVTSAI